MKGKGAKVVSLLMAAEITVASMFTGGAVFAQESVEMRQTANAENTVQGSDKAAADFGISNVSLPEAYAGEAYSVMVDVYGGQAPYTFRAEGLPAGLSIAADSGLLTGMPAAGQEGEHSVEVTVHDSSVTPKVARSIWKLHIQGSRLDLVEDQIAVGMIGHYSVGTANKDGGVAEIVKYNKDNGKFYLVNGSTQPASLEIISLGDGSNLQRDKRINIEELANNEGFQFGDLTSVDVNTETDRIAAAVQEQDHAKPGKVLVLDYEGGLVKTYETGVQPDMVKYTSDGRYILTADEGEPRTATAPDPEGSVTIVDTVTDEVFHLKFDQPDLIDDKVHVRGPAEADGAIRTRGSKADAVHDLEPEYISLSGDETTAYVSLQENNAIAVVDIAGKSIKGVHGLGHKDFNLPGNELDLVKDGSIKLENVPFYGMYMPDGIATYSAGGKQYVLTANEGDATGWPERSNESKIGNLKAGLDPSSPAAMFLADKGTAYDKVEVAADMVNSGLYLYGGRSFSIWNAEDMSPVYDSGSDFEKITASRLPEYFNASNDKSEMDGRSAKKGPEPEYVTTGKVGLKTLAFVGLERIGGVMTYDVTNPSNPVFLNYLNTRDFQAGLTSDSGPEGLEFIAASDSPTGRPLLLVANEVSGTVAVLELKVAKVTVDQPALELAVGAEPVRLNASVEQAGGGHAGLAWSSSDESVATVDGTGLVTPLAEGDTVIAVTSEDGYGSAEVPVKVKGSAPGGEPWKLTVMHTNDTHAHLADVARRATLVKQVRSEARNTLLVDAGDVFSGDLYFTKWFGLADLAFMNYMGYDAMTFGNHEFDQGTKALAEFVAKAKFPLVSSNIDFSKDSHIAPLLKNPAIINKDQTTENAGVYPYVILEVDGRKIGVFGLTTEDTAETSSPGKDVTFRNAAEATRETVEAIGKEGPNIIIGLSHLGYARDKGLAEAVEGIDLIVGGHTHTKLETPEVVTDSRYHTPTVIVQANEWGKYLGRVDLAFDKHGVVQTGPELGGRLIPVDGSVEEDAQAKEMLAPYDAELKELMGRIIGKAAVLLDGKRENVRSKETNLGNLIADGMLAKAKELKNADVAIMNGGGIRASINAGEITMGELRTVMPFGNTLFVMDVTGQQLKGGLENGISGAKLTDLPGKFPQIAGMKFKWDPSGPAGNKVFDVQIKKGGSYTPLVLSETYRLATNSFVAKGGDGYKSFAEAIAEGRYNEDLGYPDYEIFMEHVTKLGGEVSPSVEGRITEQKKPSNPGGGPSPGSGSESGGSSGGGGSATAPSQPNPPSQVTKPAPSNVLTAKEAHLTVGTGSSGEPVDQVTVKEEALKKAVETLTAGGKHELVIQVPELNRAAEISLSAAWLERAAKQDGHAALVVETGLASFRIPLQALNLGSALKEGDLGKANVKVRISPAGSGADGAMERAAASMGASFIKGSAVRFEVAIGAKGKEQGLSDFGKTVVSRILPVPSSANAGTLVAVMYDASSGTFRFVPALHVTVNGKPAIEVKHTGSGIYALLQYKKTFADLDGHWAKSEIESMASRLFVKGISDGHTFVPGQEITRGEFTAMLIRGLGLMPGEANGKFRDVAKGYAFSGEIGGALRYGMIQGGDGGTFAPNDRVTRAEMAVMTARALRVAKEQTEALKGDGKQSRFKDEALIPAWASADVRYLAERDIIRGDKRSNFGATDPVTRAQAVVVLLRIMKQLDLAD
ncbi:choice-of-anchor I family protein [Paenibacillus sp. DMB20]|uniref:choice-of-anchor I family protein n=1 Tax=Paenibacillus sp. DMB20 TaxID=1642570 RepID=UPI000627707B|nr:choice-of-anchor I family protein [Paenibacillus sp. DMB20]KKO54549.1 5'-nucleotidase [Paenibacillus sp. DMB20]